MMVFCELFYRPQMDVKMQREIVENRVVVLGKAGVGKSTLLKRYVEGKFDPHRNPTKAASYLEKKTTDGQQLLQIFDTAGDDKYSTMMGFYYRQASVALVLYDSTDLQSFYGTSGYDGRHQYNGVDAYINELIGQDFDRDHIILVGTKTDLHDQRQVAQKELKQKATEHGVQFFECSSQNGANVESLFSYVHKLVHSGYQEKVQQQVVIDEKPKNTINTIFEYIEKEIHKQAKSANPWGVGFFGSRYLKTEQGKRARVPKNIRRIYDLCKKARVSGSRKTYERSLKTIARIVTQKELLIKDSPWTRLLKRIRNFLARRGWSVHQTTREDAYGPIYEQLADNEFLVQKASLAKVGFHSTQRSKGDFPSSLSSTATGAFSDGSVGDNAYSDHDRVVIY